MKEKIEFFLLRGGIDYRRLGPVYKAMMVVLKRMIEQKEESGLRDEDRQILKTYGKAADFTDKSSLMPLLECVNKWEQESI